MTNESNVTRFLSDNKMEEYLRAKLTTCLQAAGILEYNSYAWSDPDTPDPDYVGHAMWQVHPAYEAPFSFFDRESATPRPTERQVALMRSSADFEGLMRTARLSIGLFLFHSSLHERLLFSDDSFYDLHWMSSVIYLSTASERIRDFFIRAVFDTPTTAYAKGKFSGISRRNFTTPFIEAAEKYKEADDWYSFDILRKLAGELWLLKEERDAIVHEVATSIGRRETLILNQCSEKVDGIADDFTFKEMRQRHAEIEKEHSKKIEVARTFLAVRYNQLISASNEAFKIEHNLRRTGS
jgi:hypothetical protein